MKNIYDKLLTKGLSQLKNLEFSNVPEADEIEYTFSDKYIKRKEKLLKKIGHSYWKYVNTVAKKVAVIIVTLIITLSSLMTVDAFREKLVNFVYKIYTTFTEITSNNSESNIHIEKFYAILNTPKQYKKDFVNNQTSIKASTYWIDKDGKYIILTQAIHAISSKFNSEHGALYERIVNDTPCLVCKDKDLYYCYWEFDDYRFELVYPIDLGEEFMSEVVGKLVEIDPEELNN